MLHKHSAFFPKRKKLTHTCRQIWVQDERKGAKEEQQEGRRWNEEQKWGDWKGTSVTGFPKVTAADVPHTYWGHGRRLEMKFTLYIDMYTSKWTLHLTHCSSQSSIPDNRSCGLMGQHSGKSVVMDKFCVVPKHSYPSGQLDGYECPPSFRCCCSHSIYYYV